MIMKNANPSISNVEHIEHRCSVRKHINTKVVIYKNSLPIALGRSLDVGLQGMSIESPSLVVVKNCSIELEFQLDDSTGKYYRIPCFVVHTDKDVFGVFFTFVNETTLNALKKALGMQKTPSNVVKLHPFSLEIAN
jgi:hypothetical protein